MTILAAGCLLAMAADSLAHIQLVYPPARTSSQKVGPCGTSGSTRGETITMLSPGARITVQWDETIDHPGHYRISFDADGDDDFVDPATMDELGSNDAVLVDGIPDQAGSTPRRYEQTITLPDIECDNCTLQLIQVMYDKPPYGDGNDMYYQCADLILTRTPGATPDAGPGGGGTDAGNPPGGKRDHGGCRAMGSGSAGTAGLVLLILAVCMGHRRARARTARRE